MSRRVAPAAKVAAVLAAVLAAGAAQAQTAAPQTSSVTLFGVLDAAVRHARSGDDSVNVLGSGGLNSSRLGVRGTEDLGGGLRAGFWLEHGFNLDTGALSDSARFWNRRATVSLGGSFGEVRLGRDFVPSYQGYADYDVFGDNGVAASSKFDSALGSGRDTGTRADNLVTYLTPGNLGGFYARLAVAAGEGTAGRKYLGGRVGWKNGPIDVSAAYGRTEVTPLAGDDQYEVTNIGGSYDFGFVKTSAYAMQSSYADQKLTTLGLGAAVPLGAGTVRAAYTRAQASGTNAIGQSLDGNDADQLALGYVHDLSKRTALYSTVAQVRNKGRSSFGVASSPTVAPGEKSTGVEVGVRHLF